LLEAAAASVAPPPAPTSGAKGSDEALVGLQRSNASGMGQRRWSCLQCSFGSVATRCWSAGRTRQDALEAAGAAVCGCCSQFV